MSKQIDFKDAEGRVIDKIVISKNESSVLIIFRGGAPHLCSYSVIDGYDEQGCYPVTIDTDGLFENKAYKEDLSDWIDE